MSRADREAFWDRAEMAERMGGRPPDHRFVALMDEVADPGRILDVGCAGGRNAAFAAERGADVHAFDAAPAMVDATRARLAGLGVADADARVRRLDLLDLPTTAWPATLAPFGVVLALGVLQDLPDAASTRAVLARLASWLAPDGTLLLANFGPESRTEGVPLTPVADAEHAYLGFGGEDRRMTLPDAATLDAWAADAGLRPAVATETKRVATDAGHRDTINASYRPAGAAG
ncbi:MAG: class I SAM-dependent methyltransferase [Trueperaceae bacterium]|nr:class I SAM-dependent methyltransferase [Trueperaceae bacterium]